MNANRKLEGKRVVVLGGTSGIGLATARSAIARGALVVVTSRSAEKVTSAVRDLGHGARGEVADLEKEDETRALFDRIGSMDHLVYTAGGELLLSRLDALDLGAARRAFEVRFFGAIAAAKFAVPKIRTGGSIVLTHGVAGARPQPAWSIGASICGAMDALTRALAVELAPIRVNAVSPGFVRTPLWDPIPESERESLFRSAGEKLLTRRIGEPDEIGEVYCHLMENTFTTGQTLVVDGGALLV